MHTDSNSPGVLEVRAAHQAGAEAWEGVTLPFEDFARHVEACLAGTDANEVLARQGKDLYLACACAQGDARAIELFSTRYLGAVPAMVAHIVPRAALVEELVQSLHETMLVRRGESPPQIAGYRGTGSLAGWVRISATRAAVRMKKRAFDLAEQPMVDGPAAGLTIGPETLYLRRHYGPAFDTAVAEAIAELPDEPRETLRRYYVEGLTIDQLAERDGVHRATAARRVEAARKMIFVHVRERAAQRFGVPDDEIDSLLRLVASRLSISLRQL